VLRAQGEYRLDVHRHQKMNPATRPISAKASVTAIPRNIVTSQLTGHLRLAAHAFDGFTDDNADTDTGAECCEPVTGRAESLGRGGVLGGELE